MRWRLRSDQDETANAVWVAQRLSLREKGPRRSTDNSRSLDPECVHERIHVGGEVVNRVAAFGLLRVPVPALGEREGMVLGREQWEHPAEGEPGIGVPVQKDDGFPCSVALLGIVERQVRREARRGELHPIGLVHRYPLSRAYPHGRSILTRHPDAIWRSEALLPNPAGTRSVGPARCRRRPSEE